jgi:hypothetical protein
MSRVSLRAIGAVCIALFSLGAPLPAQASRPFNEIEESAVQVALEYWGKGPSCVGGFGRFLVTNEEMDSSPGVAGRQLGGYAAWDPGAPTGCRIVLAQRAKRDGYAAFCTIVTHEIGHLIRLDDWHSDHRANVMFERPATPTPHCRARAAWMLAQSDRLEDRADALRRRCRRLRRSARIARSHRCDHRVKATTARASQVRSAVDFVR